MTTAHRPTWNPAIGGEDGGHVQRSDPSKMVSSKDQPSHLNLKLRQPGQGTRDELEQVDLKAELIRREREAMRKRGKLRDEDADEDANEERAQIEGAKSSRVEVDPDADAEDSDSDDFSGKAEEEKDKSDDDDDSDSSDDEEDDTLELMRELERIKKERAEEAARKEKEAAVLEAKKQEEAVLRGNPLLNDDGPSTFQVKRRWDDDVVFKNQARDEPKQKKRFINDTIRNDFHKRFLDRYIQ